MDILSSEIFQDFKAQGLISAHYGTDTRVYNIVPAELAGEGDLVFVEHEKYLSVAQIEESIQKGKNLVGKKEYFKKIQIDKLFMYFHSMYDYY